MPTRRYYANNAPQQTLSSSITSGATTLTVTSFTGWPTSFPFFAALDYGTGSLEIVSVTNIVSNTATIVRAQGGTSAVSHAAGATFDVAFVAQDFDEANAHTSASSGVHSVSGNVVGDSDTQTLTNKTINSPTIDSPTFTGTNHGMLVPTGTVLMYGSSTVPSGYLACDGSAVSRTTYAALFAVIGTSFGAGDGSTTFNLPPFHDGTGRMPRATGTPGETGGSTTHTHPLSGNGYAEVGISAGGLVGEKTTTSPSWTADREDTGTSTTGGSFSIGATLGGNTDANTAMFPPYVSVQFMIKT